MGYLVESTKKFEQMKDPNWDDQYSSYPTKWLQWSGNTGKLVPIPTPPCSVRIGYVQMTDLFTAGSTASVDTRIPPTHNEYLKYAAAYYLLNMKGERQYVELGDKLMSEFHKLIGA